MKGVYRFDIPDTILASSPAAIVYFYGAASMAPVVAELEIVAYDPFNATSLGLSRIDAAITSRLAGASYAAPDNTSITSIKTQTDKFVFTVANQVDANIQYVNDVLVNGVGSVGNPWGP